MLFDSLKNCFAIHGFCYDSNRVATSVLRHLVLAFVSTRFNYETIKEVDIHATMVAEWTQI